MIQQTLTTMDTVLKLTSMVSGFAPRLPAELLDIIIGYNEESVQDIRAASLVSKAWRSTALRYLFKYADFSLARDFQRWHTILTEVPNASAFVRAVQFSPGSRCDEKAMETLAQKYSHVEHYKQSRSYLNDVLPALSAANSEIDMVLPPDTPNLPPMPSVTKFTWNNRMAARRLGVRAFRPSTEHFLRCFPNVRELEVGGHFSTLADLFKVLRCFPHIRTVTLDNVAIRSPSLAGTRKILPTGALHQVEKLRAIFDEPCEIN
ncbi:hypothetical protein CYLTODRAFT_292927 [Cylindrobasidium torrendii FP15055 ss-10]|uniref:F-box domain-containing protein n=1 Tax=Cylindrobasidium torrendii FP15055 ss-10 TaxID=1314674 RepID=A0A0D7BD02_9AGAR|nr:hypothetical protein CYLTODRAFT_292927 [Cylindrobasidium torrendii FP15055 ss-10]